jgi:hypothetical protein
VTLARAIGAQVIAKGVETLQQLTALSALEVDSASGYLLARPSAPEHLPLTIPPRRPFAQPCSAESPGTKPAAESSPARTRVPSVSAPVSRTTVSFPLVS